MAKIPIPPLTWKLEVFKNSVQLFNTRFTQILIYPNLIVFTYDLYSECAVLSPVTNISLLEDNSVAPDSGSVDNSTSANSSGHRIRIEIPHSAYSDQKDVVYEIEALKSTSAQLLYNEILIAAGQKLPLPEPTRPSTFTTSTIGASDVCIQQLSSVLVRCLESMTNTFLETYRSQW